MLTRRFFLTATLLAATGLASGANAASPAEAYVNTVGNSVLAAARANSVAKFRSLLRANADIPAIALFSLGAYRKSLTKNVQAEYFKLVEDYIANVFTSHASQLAGDKLEVVGSQSTGDSVLVKSKVTYSGGKTVPVTWRIVKRGGGYKIFDVNVDGIWLATTQKTNFVTVLKKNKGDINALLAYLRA